MPVLLMSFSSPTVLALFLLFHSCPLFPFRYLQVFPSLSSPRLSSPGSLLTPVLSSFTYFHLCLAYLSPPRLSPSSPTWQTDPTAQTGKEASNRRQARTFPVEGLQSPLPGPAEELEEPFIALFARSPPDIFTQSYKTTTTFSLPVSTRIACCPQSWRAVSRWRQKGASLLEKAGVCWCWRLRVSDQNLSQAPGELDGWLALSQSEISMTEPSQSEHGRVGALGGGPGRVRIRPLQLGGQRLGPGLARAEQVHGLQGPGALGAGRRCPSTPANFPTGLGLNRYWCLPWTHLDSGLFSLETLCLWLGTEWGRCLDDDSMRAAVLLSVNLRWVEASLPPCLLHLGRLCLRKKSRQQ